jgi:lipoyl(octanoyl) transferase
MVAVEKIDLGVIDYKEAWDYQERLFAENVDLKFQHRQLQLEKQKSVVSGQPSVENSDIKHQTSDISKPTTKNYLLLCEHPHVYTLGKSGKPENLLVGEQGLKDIDATYYKINRGGDITYHGFGQMVVYPIWDLETYFYTDIHRFLRELEEVVIQTMADFGIEAGRVEGLTGVWIDSDNPDKARKICAMGIRCSRWITMHGIALNVNSNLDYFNYIVPCGIDDKAVTSMEKELNQKVDFEKVKQTFTHRLSQQFGIEFLA